MIWNLLFEFQQKYYPDNEKLEIILRYKLDWWFSSNVKELLHVKETNLDNAYTTFMENWKKPIKKTVLTMRLSTLLKRLKRIYWTYVIIDKSLKGIKRVSVIFAKPSWIIKKADEIKETTKKMLLNYLMS
jgi:hypothetical protein